ncbi:MAG: T9SS type A sorting domain-containing protein [Bacteroidota bacterium]
MKKTVLFVSGILLLTAQSNAQITLTSSSYASSLYGTDSLKVTTAASAFPSLAAGTNMTWNMNVVTDSVANLFIHRVPAAGFQFADSTMFGFSTFAYQGNVLTNLNASAITQSGIKVPRIAYPTPTATMPTDSVVINAQTITYSTPRTVIAFPATMGSTWASTYSSDFTYALSFFPLYTAAPGIVRTYATEKDTVTGWGKMRVKNAAGVASDYSNVLQVRSTTMHTDSFFLSGAPMNPSLLSSLGLTQGRKDTVYEQNYYRSGEVTPMATVAFKDAGYTQPRTARTHVQRVGVSSVAGIGNAVITVYPNPATTAFYADVPAGTWNYQLIDAAGKTVTAAQQTGSSIRCAVPAGIASGVYFLKLTNDNNEVVIRQVEIAH